VKEIINCTVGYVICPRPHLSGKSGKR